MTEKGIGASSRRANSVWVSTSCAQTAVGNQVIAKAEEADETSQRVERKDLLAPDLAPDLGQRLRRSRRVAGREAM